MLTRPQKDQRPGKVLVVVGNTGMGDAVESLPVFEMIREYWPHVHLAAGYFRETQRVTFELSPHVSEKVRLFGGVRYPWKSMKGFFVNFKAMRGYDKVLFLYKRENITWPVVLAAKLAGACVLYKHGYRCSDERRTTYSDFPEHGLFQIAASHLLLGLPLTRLREPGISLSEEDNRFANDLFNSKGLGRKPTVIINTQSNHPDWGIEKYARVANALVDWGVDVVINGGAKNQVRQFESVVDHLRRGVILVAVRSPRNFAAVIGKCNLYVGAPTGAASVAIAVGTPTVILLGPGEGNYPGQERIGPAWWPRDPRHKLISKFDWCQLNMGPECKCLRPNGRRVDLLVRMKRLGMWEPWKMVRKAHKKVRKSLGMYRRRTALQVYPCLEAITVEEVVEAAKAQLRGTESRVV